MHTGDFEVYIQSDGKRLEEYDVGEYDEDGKPTYECYISSEAGKMFTICWREEEPSTDMLVECYVDGQLVDEVAHLADVGRDNLQGVTVSQEKYRPFMFQAVKYTDNRKIAASVSRENLLGTIVLMLTKVDYWRPARKHIKVSLGTVENPRPIHIEEDAVGGHCVCFGRPTSFPKLTQRRNTSYTIQEPVGIDETGPFLCFCFIYLPKEVLLAKGIICQPSSSNTLRSRSSFETALPVAIKAPAPPPTCDKQDNDKSLLVPAGDGTGPSVMTEAQIEEEVRDLQAQMDDLRRQLKMKKRLLARSAQATGCTPCGRFEAHDCRH